MHTLKKHKSFLLLFLITLLTFIFLVGCQSYETTEYYPVKDSPSTKEGEPKLYGSVKKETKQSGYRESDFGKNVTIKGSAF